MPARAPGLPRWAVLPLCVLTVLAVGGLSLLLFRADLTEDEGDPDVVATEVGDAFDRPDARTLADAEHTWEEAAGRWGVQGGRAVLLAPAPGGPRSLAILPGAGADGTVRITAAAVQTGWGVAFRVADDQNYWSVVARSDAWAIEQVHDGVPSEQARVGVVPADGARIEVSLDGDRVAASVGGTASEAVTDTTLTDALGLGLLAVTDQPAVTMAWDDLEASLTPPSG